MFGQGAPNERINGSKLQNLFPSLRFKWINWILGNTGEARMTRMARMTLLRNPNLNPSAANFYTAAAVGHWGKDLFHILNREQERGSRSWWLLTLYHPNESVEICYKDIDTIWDDSRKVEKLRGKWGEFFLRKLELEKKRGHHLRKLGRLSHVTHQGHTWGRDRQWQVLIGPVCPTENCEDKCFTKNK